MVTNKPSPKTAITAAEFDAALQKIGIDKTHPKSVLKIAVAFSGGGDSMALALLMHDWVKAHGGELMALTVDHKLRPESTAEAALVQKTLQSRGIAHEILTWQGDKPKTHVQELAREARYDLLLDACRKRGFTTLAVAHNLEDQIETFWMRLAHGSGPDGLAGMAATREVGGVTIIRPVMGFSRAQLRATCTQSGVRWIEDPSNHNDKYLRVKLREFEEALAGEGLTPARLALTLQKMEDAREALQIMTWHALGDCVHLHPEGYATLKIAEWKQFPRDIQRRVLMQALSAIAPQQYHAGFDAIELARGELLDPAFAGRTLAGCELFVKSGNILIAREAAAVEGPVPAIEGKIWDNRFIISSIGNAPAIKVGALGENSMPDETKKLPFKIRRVLPALWQDGALVAVPHLNYYSDTCPPALKNSRMTFCGRLG